MSTRCWAVHCTIRPGFNHEGSKTAMYCKRHAKEGMVDVISKRCTHADGCTHRPTFNHEGSNTAIFCRQHAEESMVDVTSKRCAHAEGCTRRPGWGYWADGTIVCAKHKGDLTEGHAINFTRQCKVAGVKGCSAVARWGEDGQQPTHCKKHGAPRAGEGFVPVPSSGRRTPASFSSLSTASGRRHSTGGERPGTGDGGVKRPREAVPRCPVESWLEEESDVGDVDNDAGDGDIEGRVGKIGGEADDEEDGEPKVKQIPEDLVFQ